MLKDFIDFMNQVKAEEDLKENTINYVDSSINSNLNNTPNKKLKRRNLK